MGSTGGAGLSLHLCWKSTGERSEAGGGKGCLVAVMLQGEDEASGARVAPKGQRERGAPVPRPQRAWLGRRELQDGTWGAHLGACLFQLQSMAKQLGLERVRVGWGNRGKGSSAQGWSFEQLWDLQEPGPGGSAAPPAAFPVETHPRED